jgi:NAD(P)-dependent dehydrogenase (short-subunit alcohol dehydrogenase family)
MPLVGAPRIGKAPFPPRRLRFARGVSSAAAYRVPVTEWWRQDTLTSRPEMEAQIVGRHPIGRMGRPEEIAEAVVWLYSDAASFVTGHTMTVDRGICGTIDNKRGASHNVRTCG